MRLYFDRYTKLRRSIEAWCLHFGSISDIAWILQVTPSSLSEMLGWYGLADVGGYPAEDIEYQDVINAILLWYAFNSRARHTRSGL